MAYIRTKDNIVEYDEIAGQFIKDNNWKVADTIEELIDVYVIASKNQKYKPYIVTTLSVFDDIEDVSRRNDIYSSIWVNALLKPVAKMNDKGELDLL